ncbi:unnamed protein product [Microthlaspi erraticum]|uniref:Morc S5 domain-containing protein n=1 Tax=Microthlaspi erraticum TaxID=1685480 RepID=A0A6D2IYR0_9BRAS|nr:unnamed protein product [Microthlaspi erraticum]
MIRTFGSEMKVVMESGCTIKNWNGNLISHTTYAYASMLYLKKFKNFKIILRGVLVEQYNIADELRYPEIAKYKPYKTAMIEQATTEIKLGFIKEAPKIPVCGYNVYHKNRLIRVHAFTFHQTIPWSIFHLSYGFELAEISLAPLQPFWKVTAEGSHLGHGVVGVLEANFIEPLHDKQDFESSSLVNRLEIKLKRILNDYWYSHSHFLGYSSYRKPWGKSKMTPVPDPPPTVNTFTPPPSVNTFSPPPSPSNKAGPIIRELSLSKGTPVLKVAVPPPHVRNSRNNFEPVELSPQPAAATEEDAGNNLVGKSVDEISEENIQLFMKCEEYRKTENDLEQTVKNLEKELEEAKSKCAHLALLVDAKKMQMQLV